MDVPPGIEPDPALHWGTLPNGLRYVLRQQPHPPGATSLRMIVFSGFLHERPEEEGLAHFVEHMGFNGTRKFRGESLAAKLQEAGIRFGPDLSAFTWPSHTIYQLDLSQSDPAKLDLGVTVLREWASEIRFDRKQIEREKGVILAETNTRGRNRARLIAHRLAQLYPNSRLSTHLGHPENGEIAAVDRDALRDFYARWYRPDNVVIVAAGDFDPTAMADLIADRFGDWAPATTPLPTIALGEMHNHPNTRAVLVHNSEVVGVQGELTLVLPRPEQDTLQQRRADLARHLAVSALQRRHTAIARAQPGVFGRLGVTLSNPTPFNAELTFTGSERATEWQHLSRTLIDEYRRFRQHGLLPGELEVPLRNQLKAAEFTVRANATRPASNIADALAGRILWRVIPTAPEFDRDFLQQTVAELDEAACVEALRPFFADGFPILFLITGEETLVGEDNVAEFLNSTLDDEVPPPVVPEIPEFPYTDFGPAGEIARRTHDPSLDVHMVEFANGIKLNLKHTDFQADTVYLTARIDSGGRLAQPDTSLGIDQIAAGSLLEGGLGKLGPQELQAALAGRFASLSFSVGEDTFEFRGSADSHEVALMLQMLTAYITDPEVRPEAVTTAKQNYHNRVGEAFRDPHAALSLRGTWDLFNEDNRFGFFAPQHINRLDPISVRAWLLAGFNEAPIEIGLVGDLDVEDTIAQVAATLGTLPPRQPARFQVPARLRRTPVTRALNVQTTESQIAVMLSWHAAHLETARRRRTLEILSWVLRNMLFSDVREKLGIIYDPGASHWVSHAVKGEGFLSAHYTVRNTDLKRAVVETQKIINRLVKKGLPKGALERAREPLLQLVPQQLESNDYWLKHVVSQAQTNPEALIMPHTRESDLASITEEEVEAMAKEVLHFDRTILFLAGR